MVLFLDFDGTLAPIVRRPELARFPEAGRKNLAALAKQIDLKAVIISGRLLADVKKKVGVSGLTYVGNHGLEMRGSGIRFLHPEASQAKKLLKGIARRLQKAFQGIRGVWVENKTYTLSIHYREAEEPQVIQAKKALWKAILSELKSGDAVLTEGKKVWEVRPRIDWNKGAAVQWLCRHFEKADGRKYRPVYLGDDVTDESAFKVLRGHGVTVKVTLRPQAASAAKFYLKTPSEVHSFLNDLRVLYAEGRENS